jgi:hypothetical protein
VSPRPPPWPPISSLFLARWLKPFNLSVPQGIDAENFTDAVQLPAASPLLCST